MMRVMNGLAVYALGPGLERLLAGGRLRGARRYPGGLTLRFAGARIGYLHLLLPGRAAELVPSAEALVPEDTGEEAFTAAAGTRLAAVRALGLDRVLLLTFEPGGAWTEPAPLVLRLDLSGAFRAAVLFKAGSPRPLESFGGAGLRLPEGPETLPPARPWSLLDRSRLPSPHEIEKPGPGTAARLAARIGGLDPLLAGALEAELRGDREAFVAALADIAGSVAAGKFAWKVYDLPGPGGEPVCAVYPVALPLPARAGAAEGLLEALAVRAAEVVLPAWTDRLRAGIAARRRRMLQRTRRLLENVGQDLLEAQRAAELRHMGNLLVTWRHMLRTGQKEITVRDHAGDREVTIPLEPALAPDANIRRYFRRAKKGAQGQAVIQARRSRIRAEVRRLEQELAALEQNRDPAALAALEEQEAPAAVHSRARAPAPRFKRFTLGEGYVILVGRSDRENDELTHRFAAATDLWFHAQGYSGSHVILKGAGPSTPARIIRAAAETAAWFSRGKHSGTVPVIYAEKRYVRKPRGSRPGTASCLRSKTLLVTPRLPRGDAAGEE